MGPDQPSRPLSEHQRGRSLQRRGRSAWPCSGRGLPSQPGHPGCWCALTAPFHPYRGGKKTGAHASRGGLLSVALSRALRPVGVADHPVLWSPDFPLLPPDPRRDNMASAATVRPTPRPSEPYRNGRLEDRRFIIAAGSRLFLSDLISNDPTESGPESWTNRVDGYET